VSKVRRKYEDLRGDVEMCKGENVQMKECANVQMKE
jgi:hypothetical protein